jgi:5-methylcytosine-specific restriction endonuclease McrA
MQKEKQNIMVGMVQDYWKSQIKIPDVQREDTAWTVEQKQLLIDSIYNNYDIPKFYFRRDNINADIWWLLDGQQRLTAISDFLEDKFPLGGDVTSIPNSIHNKKFSELSPADKSNIKTRTLDFVIMVCSDEEEEDLFLRLNKGTPLNAAEKRNAVKGEFKDLVKMLALHPFFKNKINFPTSRFAVDAVVAQLCVLALNDSIVDIKGKQIMDVYLAKKRFPEKDKIEKKVSSTLTWMNQIFKKKETYLKKYNIWSIFIFHNNIKNNYAISGITSQMFFEFFNSFETARQINNQKTEDDSSFDRDLNAYTIYCVNGSDSQPALFRRNSILLKKFLTTFPNIATKDSNRNFTQDQKESIYYLCEQKCQGVAGFNCPESQKKLSFEDVEFDHIVEHADGGESTVNNGQVLCQECHRHKTKSSIKKRKVIK